MSGRHLPAILEQQRQQQENSHLELLSRLKQAQGCGTRAGHRKRRVRWSRC